MLDLLIYVGEDFLSNFPGKKGGMQLVEYSTLMDMLEKSAQEPVVMTGGSASNTIKGLSQLGNKGAFFGKIGSDLSGQIFIKGIEASHVTSLLIPTEEPTGIALCLITPDKERTLRTFKGSGSSLNAQDLHPSLFQGKRLVHIEGYMLLIPELVQTAIRMAKAAGASISFDLASFEIAENFKSLIQEITPHIDVLFANEKEAEIITQLPAEKACQKLSALAKISVVTMGKNGAWAAQKGEHVYCPAIPLKPTDTTGAGDLFASGFLSQYLSNKNLLQSLQLGTKVAAEVIQVIGAHLPPETWQKLKAAKG